jgi:hypothetical protein
MSSGSLGTLTISLAASTSAFTTGMEKARRDAESSFGKIGAMAKKALGPAAVIGAGGLFAQQIKANADFAESMARAAERAGTTAEAFSKLQYAAGLSDVSTTALSKGLRALGTDAANGGKALQALGVELTNGAGQTKSSNDLFTEVAERISKIEDPAKRAAAATKAFGDRLGAELTPLLSGGAESLKKAADEAKRFGLVVQDDSAAAAIAFNDSMTRLAASARGMSISLTGPAISSLANITESFLTARAAGLSFIEALDRGLQARGNASGTGEAERQVIKAREEFERLQKIADQNPDPFNIYQSEVAYSRLMDKVRQLGTLQREEAEKTARATATAEAAEEAIREKMRQDTVARQIDRQRQAFASFRENLVRQAEGYRELTAVESTLAELASNRLGTVTAAQRESLLLLAAEADKKREIIELEQQRNALTAEGISVTMGLRTAFEKAGDEEARLQELFDQGAISADTLARGVAKIRSEFAASSAPIQQFADTGVKAMTDLQRAVEGWGEGFNRTMVDAVMSGKLNFRSLTESILRDLLTIQIRASITGPLMAAMGGNPLASIGSAIFGGGRALGGPVKAGVSYLTGERGPEIFTPTQNGTIIPNSGTGGGNNINVYVTNSGTRTEGGDGAGKALGQLVAASVNSALINAKRPGGLLA